MTSNGQQPPAAFTEGPSNQVDVIDTRGGRILCVADVRGALCLDCSCCSGYGKLMQLGHFPGKLSTLNALAIEHNAKAIIHTGDFGFYGQ